MADETLNQPIEIFYSYAHRDERLRKRLEDHLAVLRRRGLVAGWHDRDIDAGTEWKTQIDTHLQTAQIILLLISGSFLASDYCYELEMKVALERHDRREARVIPIILRPCLWKDAPFARLQVLPRDGKPVTAWPSPDEAFLSVAEGILAVVKHMRGEAH
ncbi:MAG TPA: toll/interleukin-1 receptor domain-containing protein [Blastocatellia bacterium]|nr:toll/interleukin-1 receptor domain-containing protein [Blastocatellia bacterium]